MKKIEKSIVINAPAEEVFTFLTNPNNLPSVWPSLVEVKNEKHDASGAHSFDWTYKMAGIHFHGHAESTEVEKNRRVVSKNEGGIPSTFTYTYSPKDGGTELRMTSEYELPDRAIAKLAEPLVTRINEREAETLLHNLKAVLEHRKSKAAEQRAPV